MKRVLPQTASAARLAGGWRKRLLSRPIERPTIDAEDRAAIAAHFTQEVARLRDFTGQPFAGWSV